MKVYDNVSIETREHESEDKAKPKQISCIMSSTSLDSHYSRMSERTLDNFARDAQQGVTFLESHNHRSLGIGKTVSGQREDNKVIADVEIIRNQPLNPPASFPNTDNLIRYMEEGYLNAVSVGFFGHTEICDICEADWLKCTHWPGMSYTVNKEEVLCTSTIDNAQLSELSAVYDGSNDDAVILERAQRCFRDGHLNDKEMAQLSNKYGIRSSQLSEEGTKFYIPAAANERGIKVNKMENKLEEQIEELKLDKKGLREQLDKAQERVTELEKEIEDNKIYIELGKEAQTEKQKETVALYKELRGADLVESELELFNARLSKMSLKEMVSEQAFLQKFIPTEGEDEKSEKAEGGRKAEVKDPNPKPKAKEADEKSGKKEDIF